MRKVRVVGVAPPTKVIALPPDDNSDGRPVVLGIVVGGADDGEGVWFRVSETDAAGIAAAMHGPNGQGAQVICYLADDGTAQT